MVQVGAECCCLAGSLGGLAELSRLPRLTSPRHPWSETSARSARLASSWSAWSLHTRLPVLMDHHKWPNVSSPRSGPQSPVSSQDPFLSASTTWSELGGLLHQLWMKLAATLD